MAGEHSGIQMEKIILAAAMLVDHSGRLLSVRKKTSRYFMMPGGKIEPNENQQEALIRELEEELGLKVAVQELHYLGNHKAVAVNEKNTVVHAAIYLLRISDASEIRPQSEIEEIAWLTRANYHRYKLAHLLSEFTLPRWLNDAYPQY